MNENGSPQVLGLSVGDMLYTLLYFFRLVQIFHLARRLCLHTCDPTQEYWPVKHPVRSRLTVGVHPLVFVSAFSYTPYIR